MTVEEARSLDEQRADAEKKMKHSQHPDFKAVETSRPDWPEDDKWVFTKTRKPDWNYGQGPNDGGECLVKNHVSIDPYEPGRPAPFNYKLLISAIIPRPIGFCSTESKDGKRNLAPFSYFQVISHDPPLFIFGFSRGFDNPKDTLRNLVETGECCINVISEHFIEAANACSIDAPQGVSEWELSGLHPAACKDVKPPRVQEAVFSVEAKLHRTEEFESKVVKGKKTGVLVIVEGIRFWAREDAINKERNLIDPNVLRAMGRLGGITYSRTLDGMELPRPDWERENKNGKLESLLKDDQDGHAQL